MAFGLVLKPLPDHHRSFIHTYGRTRTSKGETQNNDIILMNLTMHDHFIISSMAINLKHKLNVTNGAH